jgi:hypothetical protein
MEALSLSKTSVLTRATRRNTPEDGSLDKNSDLLADLQYFNRGGRNTFPSYWMYITSVMLGRQKYIS